MPNGIGRKIVIILDCCYSGAAGQGFKGAVDDQLQQLNNARGTYLVTASTELQVAHESAAEGLSLFTKHLIAGLETGEADKDGDGWVSMNELYDYVQGKVVAENPTQQPTKHVKDERGGLFIAKSGRNLRSDIERQYVENTIPLVEKQSKNIGFELSEKAKQILIAAIENPRGGFSASYRGNRRGLKIQARGHLIKWILDDKRSMTLWEDAIEELLDNKLSKKIKNPHNNLGQLFEITHKGYEIGDILKSQISQVAQKE